MGICCVFVHAIRGCKKKYLKLPFFFVVVHANVPRKFNLLGNPTTKPKILLIIKKQMSILNNSSSITNSTRLKHIWRKKIVSRWQENNGQLTQEGKRIDKVLPRDRWEQFDPVFHAIRTHTRAGKYIRNCFEDGTVELTTTGRRMKRYLAQHHQHLGVGGRPLLDYLLEIDDATLKQRFGRKFLNVRKEKRNWTGYNLFISEHGFAAHRIWNTMDAADKDRYNTMAKNTPVAREIDDEKIKKANTWTMAVKEWNRQRGDNRNFAPIKIGTNAYLEIKEIQAKIKSEL